MMNRAMKNNIQKSEKRNVNGILLLDKPSGMSSNIAVQKVKKIFKAKKAGHTGSLDPLATGMLPICFGDATKFSQYLLDADKSYLVSAKLGERTNTSDAEGEIVSKRDVPDYSLSELNQAFDVFRGEIEQVPSMFSAIKYQGQPLYKLARQGITIERKKRKIRVSHLQVIEYLNHVIHFEIHCSKGTYVRSLVDDFGEQLGCGAHIIQLRRLNVNAYRCEEMISLDQLETLSEQELQHFLLPIDSAIAHWPRVNVSTSMAFYLRQGQAVLMSKAPKSGWVRIYVNDQFIGIGEMQDSKIAPRRLIAN